MSLLISIPLLCFLTSFIQIITKKISGKFNFESCEEKQLQEAIRKKRAELRDIPMRQEYTAYVKLERQIVNLEEQLLQAKNSNQTKILICKYGIAYGLNAIFLIALMFISFYYRYTSVMTFDKSYNFAPIGGMMAFPTGKSNAISVPFWIFVSKVVVSAVLKIKLPLIS